MDTAIQLNNRENSKSTLMFIYAIGLGFIFDLLFYDKYIGLNYPLYALFFLGGIYLFTKEDESFSLARYMIFSAIIMYTALSFVRFSFSSLINILNFFVIPVMFALLPAIIKKDFQEEKNLPLIAIDRFIRSLGGFLFLVEKTFRLSSSAVGTRDKSKTYSVIAGIFLSLLAMAVIIPLMASADMIFNEIMLKITRNMTRDLEFDRIISHIFIIFLVSGYTYGFLGTVMKKQSSAFKKDFNSIVSDLESKEGTIVESKSTFDSTIPITIFLCAMNLIFLLFSYIQVKYIIFGGTDFLPENISYAEYARSGFFQMMVLSIMNFSITIFINGHILKMENTNKLKVLLTTLSIFTIIVVFSSYSRMNLYENTFGYTRLRFLVYIILFTEAGLNLMLMYSIWNKGFEFIRYGLLSVLLVFLMLNTVNIDGYIASRNIDRYFQTGQIDLSYLRYSLSNDASSELLRLKGIPEFEDKLDTYFKGKMTIKNQNSSIIEFNLSDRKAYEKAIKYFKK